VFVTCKKYIKASLIASEIMLEAVELWFKINAISVGELWSEVHRKDGMFI